MHSDPQKVASRPGAFSPIKGAALRMSNRDNDHSFLVSLKRQRVREPIKKTAINEEFGFWQTRPGRKTLRRGIDALQRGAYGCNEFISEASPATVVPHGCIMEFRESFIK